MNTFLFDLRLYLFEKPDVVRVVVITKVDDTRFAITAHPIQRRIPVGNSSWFKFGFFILFRHLSCVIQAKENLSC